MTDGAIGRNRIHVYRCALRDCGSGDMLARCRSVLQPDELQRAERFHFERDRTRHLVTRALARDLLSRHVAIPPAAIRFRFNRHGRPELAGDAAGALRFNISHSAEIVVLAVTDGIAIGIDVERSDREADLDIANRFFAPSEAASLRAVPPAARGRAFFELWTLKEAYVKARGAGLSLNLRDFAFRFPAPAEVALEVAPSLADPVEQWSLWQFDMSDGHLAALCAERTAAAPQILFRNALPFAPGNAFKPRMLRRTAD